MLAWVGERHRQLQSGTPTLVCFLCGKIGHKSIACPERSSDKAPGSKVIKREFNDANTRRVVVVCPEDWKRNVLKGSSQL